MRTGQWNEPVTYETGTLGQFRTVANTAEAAHALLNHWPVDEGKALATARAVCLEVLEGTMPPEAARKAFLKAAQEADIFVRA